jgi:hypothetical protein
LKFAVPRGTQPLLLVAGRAVPFSCDKAGTSCSAEIPVDAVRALPVHVYAIDATGRAALHSTDSVPPASRGQEGAGAAAAAAAPVVDLPPGVPALGVL